MSTTSGGPATGERRRRGELWDGLVGAALLALLLIDQAGSLFQRLEWVDWVAYALPAANCVTRGVFATPQLGDQFGLDRFWLWNSPLMGLGPVPFFALGGVGRTSYLVGCLMMAIVVSVTMTALMRRALGLTSWALAVVAAYAVLGVRSYSSELSNQRYCLIVVAALGWLFFPGPPERRRDLRARWALAGSLPLMHPSLVFASAAWVCGELGLWLRSRVDKAATRPIPWTGLLLFAAGVAACAFWYLRPEPLRLQFLPQAASLGDRSGLFVPASTFFRLPTYAAYVLIVISAGASVVGFGARGQNEWGTRRAGLTVLAVVALEVTRYFAYLPYYLIGLAPCVFCVWRPTPFRRAFTAGLMAVSLMNGVIASRLDPFRFPRTDPALERAFIVRNTRPGDRIVLGPPLVLASSTLKWPEGRTVRFVVPHPYMLNTYDDARFRALIRDGADVYVGEERSYFYSDSRYYFNPLTDADRGRAPLFSGGTVRRETLYGQPIRIVRAATSPPSP